MTEAAEPSRGRLANLRPGAALADVEAAFGDRWQAPRPHRGGRVLRLASSHGVVADMDADGLLGRIQFDWRFGAAISIAGLRLGMTREALLSVHPDLKLSSLPMTRHLEHGSLAFADGVRLFVELNGGKLSKLAFESPKAVYPPRERLLLPPPGGDPGAPFADPNFKLAVLSDLMARDELDLGEPSQFLSALAGYPVDIERSGYDLNTAAYDYLVRYPLDHSLLDTVTDLEIDAGNPVYEYIWPFWDGESSDFDVRSLEGIAHLRKLRRLHLISLADPRSLDLTPVERLPNVRLD